jgi:uncharacterized membrane protein (DUF106 family)
MHKLCTVIIALLITVNTWAQSTSSQIDQQLNQTLRGNDKTVVVIAVLSTIFLAVAAYLVFQDLRLRKIEKEFKNTQTPK